MTVGGLGFPVSIAKANLRNVAVKGLSDTEKATLTNLSSGVQVNFCKTELRNVHVNEVELVDGVQEKKVRKVQLSDIIAARLLFPDQGGFQVELTQREDAFATTWNVPGASHFPVNVELQVEYKTIHNTKMTEMFPMQLEDPRVAQPVATGGCCTIA